METIGHAAHIHAKIRSLHDTMRARGASEAAIARLPKLPVVAVPLHTGLPPVVLATKQHATRPAMATVTTASAPRSSARKTKSEAARFSLGRTSKSHYKGETPPDEVQRARAIVAIVARVFGIEPYQILEVQRVRRFGPAKKVAAGILYELMGLGCERIGAILRVSCSAAKYSIRHGFFLIQTQPIIATRRADAMHQIKSRWPEYQKANGALPQPETSK